MRRLQYCRTWQVGEITCAYPSCRQAIEDLETAVITLGQVNLVFCSAKCLVAAHQASNDRDKANQAAKSDLLNNLGYLPYSPPSSGELS
jgi:hypothetical protein